jgi:hypothetical protein
MSPAMTKFRFTGALLAAAATALIGIGAARAQDATEDDLRLDDAWGDLVIDQEPILTDLQFAELNNLAFQAAVTKICDGFELDQQKFAEGVSTATSPAPETVDTPDEMKQWETAVYFRLGASYGLFLAEGNANVDKFCQSAADLKADPEVPNVWQ